MSRRYDSRTYVLALLLSPLLLGLNCCSRAEQAEADAVKAELTLNYDVQYNLLA